MSSLVVSREGPVLECRGLLGLFLLGVVGSFFVVVCHNNVLLISKAGWVAIMYDVCMMYDV